METNDSNIKPQQTGGLKLMTVFIVVLALHVVVIGGFTVYHLMSGGSADVDLTDKGSKGVKVTPDGTVVADAPLSDGSQADKSATAATAPAETTGTPAPLMTPSMTPVMTPAPAPVATASAPSPTNPVPAQPSLAPPADMAPAPSAPVAFGPVKMPPFQPAPTVAPAPVAGTTYVVKITDSYAKIAKAHHLSVAKLKEANNIKGNTLHTGQKLIIPDKTQVAVAAPATSLDSAPTEPITTDSLTAAPATGKMVASVMPSASSGAPTKAALNNHLYTIVKGDTLSKIAHKFKTTSAALMSANNITDPTKLGIGKKLKIPSKEARSAKISEPVASPTSQPSQAKAGAPTGQLANFVP